VSPQRKKVQPLRSNSELLTRREAAEYLGVAVQTLAIWKTHGRYELPMVKVGRLAKYKRSDLDKFLASRTECGPPRPASAPALAKSKNQPAPKQSIDFAEVQLVEQRNLKILTPTPQYEEAASGLEIVFPNGIKLRLASDCSLDLLPSVLAMLEKQ
jgi:excisionase family DNA binding protein